MSGIVTSAFKVGTACRGGQFGSPSFPGLYGLFGAFPIFVLYLNDLPYETVININFVSIIIP